ncbi:ExbD/TolR family protein [Coralliovum pocilloporae]|uniref:ExbD/TolR family protein n=1 Tax=Coralliovum pocilloporae TaxID=3066369 RepID=UPI003306B0BE
MRISVQHKRSALSLTSLIDVIFLLLLFFMLSSTFLRFSELDLRIANQGVSASITKPSILIRLTSDRSIRVNGKATELSGLIVKLNELEAKKAETALISAADDVTTQLLVNVLETAGQSKLKSVSIAPSGTR